MSRRVMRDIVREKQREGHDTCQDTEDREVSTEEFDVVRSKVFNFHSDQSVIMTMLKTRTNQLNCASI